MTAIPLKSIEGCLVAKLPIPELKEWGKIDEHMLAKYCAEHGNAVITQQGEVQITLSREKLAKELYCIRIGVNVSPKRWDEIGGDYKKQYYDFADAILNALPELVEVQND